MRTHWAQLSFAACAVLWVGACGDDAGADDASSPDGASGTTADAASAGEDSGAPNTAMDGGGNAGTGSVAGHVADGEDAGVDAGLDAATGMDPDAGAGDAAVDASVADGGVAVATVEAIQKGEVTGEVALVDVYVTAIDNVGAGRGIWVADALTAAAWQGVFVATGASAPGVSLGEKVSVNGTVTEFDLPSSTGDTLTELVTTVDAVTGTGITGVPVALSVGADALAGITTGEAYESVIVQLGPVRVTALASGNRVTVTDNGANSLVMDDDLFAASPTLSDCYSSVTGVMTINLADDERRLLPRSAADLTLGAGCN